MNIAFFITHKTLELDHAQICLQSVSNQECDLMFDQLYIYNTHEDELSNAKLLDLFAEYDLYRFFKDVKIFPYDDSTHKSLGGDVNAIRQFCIDNLSPKDRILIHKSDCILSKNYFNEILTKMPDRLIYFTAPFICAKRRVPNDEILIYSSRDEYIKSDEITFFVEDARQSQDTDFHKRLDVKITDKQIKFTSCEVNRDFSCHFISVALLPLLIISNQSWGGVNLRPLTPYFIGTDKCFVIHKYHGIISENRSTDREGPVKDWFNS